MWRSVSFWRFSRISCSASSKVISIGSSVFGSDTYTLLCRTYGPKRPTPTLTDFPSYSPSVRGNLNNSSASSKVMVSMDWPFFICAKRGFSSSSTVPICTTGPKRPILTETVLPVPGSSPRIRSPTLCSVLIANVFSTDGWNLS